MSRSPGDRLIRPALVAASLVCILLVAGCGRSEDAVTPVGPRPVKLFRVEDNIGEVLRRFPASIDASQRAELSFRVSGRLLELPVREGDVVTEGQMIARLDPTDYQLAVDDRQAVFDNTQRNFERARELVEDGNISRLDFDRMEADFRSARAALEQAQANLGYTSLKAPFAGRIARRDVENFEDVMAKQPIAYLQDMSQLDVIIGMPESVVRSLRGGPPEDISAVNAAQTEAGEVQALVSFDDRPEVSYALELSELATRADPDTQTYRVVFSMPQPDEFTVLPGMTAQVELDLSDYVIASSATWVPVRAVQADAELNSRVWILDSDSMQVHSRAVDVGRVSGDSIEVLSGLSGGEEVVAAGAAYLAEGMAVTRFQTGEQAMPRASTVTIDP